MNRYIIKDIKTYHVGLFGRLHCPVGFGTLVEYLHVVMGELRHKIVFRASTMRSNELGRYHCQKIIRG